MSPLQLERFVTEYISHYRCDEERELSAFRAYRTDEDAISRAGLAQRPSGKRDPHQYRIPRSALAESRRRLLDNQSSLRQARSFDDLIEHVERIIRPIRGIGDLMIYDTALRIGARFGLEPSRVYLHAGTREGARKLGLGKGRKFLEMAELPIVLRKLKPREIEDALCIFKDEFGVQRTRMPTRRC
jgi:hypothetical protein